MPVGWVLCEPGSNFDGLYFPTSGIVSLLYLMENGNAAETAVIGNDGMVGIALFMGGQSTTSRAIVQHAGHAFRLKPRALKAEFALGGRLQFLALRYAQSLLTQMAQTTVCNRHHRLDQQLCRWLLLRLDLLSGQDVLMTQEQIANTLGVRREVVTEAAGRLQGEGLIRYSRGRISLLDRAGLERRVCECYGVVRQEYQRLLPT
jgi:CRP-like cAMP-binding protein